METMRRVAAVVASASAVLALARLLARVTGSADGVVDAATSLAGASGMSAVFLVACIGASGAAVTGGGSRPGMLMVVAAPAAAVFGGPPVVAGACGVAFAGMIIFLAAVADGRRIGESGSSTTPP